MKTKCRLTAIARRLRRRTTRNESAFQLCQPTALKRAYRAQSACVCFAPLSGGQSQRAVAILFLFFLFALASNFLDANLPRSGTNFSQSNFAENLFSLLATRRAESQLE
jgi:hypothetical protein